MSRCEDRGLVTDERGDTRDPRDVDRDLWRLAYFGGEADGRTWLKLLLERLYDAFDADKQLDDLDWCAQYLLRHGRWGSLEAVERLTRSELSRRMRILSEMIQAESKPARSTGRAR